MIEHFVGASSWALKMISLMHQCPNVRNVNFNFCMLGMVSKDATGEAPAKKRTRIVTSSEILAGSLEKYQCDGAHRHVWLENGRPKACGRCSDEFCRLVLEAIKKELKDTMNARPKQGASGFSRSPSNRARLMKERQGYQRNGSG